MVCASGKIMPVMVTMVMLVVVVLVMVTMVECSVCFASPMLPELLRQVRHPCFDEM